MPPTKMMGKQSSKHVPAEGTVELELDQDTRDKAVNKEGQDENRFVMWFRCAFEVKSESACAFR